MKKMIKMLVCSLLVVSAVGFLGCEKKDIKSVTNNEKLQKLKLPLGEDGVIKFGIYFDGSKDTTMQLIKEDRIINKEDLIGEIIMQEIIKGPTTKGDLKPILPKETRLISFTIKDGIAYVNLSKEAKVSMTETKERSCLEGILTSLTQLTSVDKVKITVDNKDIESIGGHFDISKPFGKGEIILIKK